MFVSGSGLVQEAGTESHIRSIRRSYGCHGKGGTAATIEKCGWKPARSRKEGQRRTGRHENE